MIKTVSELRREKAKNDIIKKFCELYVKDKDGNMPKRTAVYSKISKRLKYSTRLIQNVVIDYLRKEEKDGDRRTTEGD